jgi:hypothetical protein
MVVRRSHAEPTNKSTNSASTTTTSTSSKEVGPEYEYVKRVQQGILVDDSHQRQTVALLQNLYEDVIKYQPPPAVEIDYFVDDAKASFRVGLEQLDDDANVFGRIYKALTGPRRRKTKVLTPSSGVT